MKKRSFFAVGTTLMLSLALVSCGAEEAKDKAEDASEPTTKHVEVAEDYVEETKPAEVAPVVIEEVAAVEISGSDLFMNNGCVACHQMDAKTVGPSIKEIGAAYADNADGLTSFLKGESDAIVDVAMAAVMAPQVETTKAMSDDERAAIVDYFMNN